MNEFIKTLLIASIPAIVTSVGALLISAKTAKDSIRTLKENNKHEINRLMEQHKLDIESLKEQHDLDLISKEKDHAHKLEIMQKEHENNLIRQSKNSENQAMFGALSGLLTEVINNPNKMDELAELQKKAEQLKNKSV